VYIDSKEDLASNQTHPTVSFDQVNKSIPATVKSVKEIKEAGTTAIGGAAGIATGAVLGSSASRNSSLNHLVGAIGGAIVGNVVGEKIEASATEQVVMEYIVETETGKLMMIVQGKDMIFVEGQKVIVLDEAPRRLIAVP
jgi:outer membrane lipoprotein SlyB